MMICTMYFTKDKPLNAVNLDCAEGDSMSKGATEMLGSGRGMRKSAKHCHRCPKMHFLFERDRRRYNLLSIRRTSSTTIFFKRHVLFGVLRKCTVTASSWIPRTKLRTLHLERIMIFKEHPVAI